MSRLYPKDVERARQLYGHGYRLQDIAAMIGRGVRTVSRWKSHDAARGLEWEDLRTEARATVPLAIVAVLERRLVKTAEDDTLPPGARGYEVRELYRVIQEERAYANAGEEASDAATKTC